MPPIKKKETNKMSNKKRSGKFYYRNEREVMQALGLEQVAGSGNGWVSKEDGENDNVLCQLKSTDAQSISIKKLDIEKLEYHAHVSHKVPVFAVNFLSDNSTYLLLSPESLFELAEYLDTGKQPQGIEEGLRIDYKAPQVVRRTVGSAACERERVKRQMAEKYKRHEKRAK